MRDKDEFLNILFNIDRKDQAEYSQLSGDFDFARYVLRSTRTIEPLEQGLSSLFIIHVPQHVAGFPADLFATAVRRTGLEDFLARKLNSHAEEMAHFNPQGIARRRLASVRPGQTIVPRSTVSVSGDYVEARISMDLPVNRDLVDAEAARELFFEDLPALVTRALLYCNLDDVEVRQFVSLMETADVVRQTLPTRGLVAFLAEGSLLARREGGDLPDYGHVGPLTAAPELLIEMPRPGGEPIRGIGIPAGVTLILGDAYSGRIELMRALAAGIYNHVPGDGRELVISQPDAVYIAADPGRCVQKVNISPFVLKHPAHPDLRRYTTSCADACASQAASVVEILEAGARVLLFDESDSAPEFLAQAARLGGLLSRDDRRIIPLSRHTNQLVNEMGVSLIVAGGLAVADFIPVADTILRVDDFHVTQVTQEARAAVKLDENPADRDADNLAESGRWVIPSSLDSSRGIKKCHSAAPDLHHLEFGRTQVDLGRLVQLAEVYQTQTIGLILEYVRSRYMDQARPIREILDLIDRDLSAEGLDVLSRNLCGDLARPRRYEIAMALNRMPSLRVAESTE